jgi:hypothetical protein
MDPLSALGISTAVVQFASFTSDLISKAKEVHASAKGCTEKILTLQTVYAQLQDLSSSLEASSRRDPKLELVEGTSAFVTHIFAINDLARLCKEDCDRLLWATRKLQGNEGSKNRWQSFRIALRTLWKTNDIADLEQRLHHTQSTLTLHLCASIRYVCCICPSFWDGTDSIKSYSHAAWQRMVKHLFEKNELMGCQQLKKLDDMSQYVSDLGSHLSIASHPPLGNTFGPRDIESLQDQVSQITLAKLDVERNFTILNSLGFEARPVRYSAIPEAHRRTFRWVFNHPDLQSSGSHLLRWLRTGDQVFWVSGKPGSGKSTLLKYISDHPETLQALSTWSYPKRVVLASHFFWSAGTPMQRSWQGLLQTLLYEIFRQVPDLIETTCIERWPKDLQQLAHEHWLLPELRKILSRIAERENLPVKFCFFIDGLDEFDGDHVEFCEALLALTRSSHIKLCVSARPWNVFEDSFGQNSSCKFYVQDLTRQDIRSYAESSLQEHPRWKSVEAEVENAQWLIDEIAERACGVFLWVFLVTRQLRNGLTEYDRFSDIRRRLEATPADLETFFKHILESVDSFYHNKMATTLQIAITVREPAPVAIYEFHDEEYEDQDYAMKLPLHPLEPAQFKSMETRITRRLNGRCKGLLEVNNHRVEFLHRTVMDYLKTADMNRYLQSKFIPGFNADLSVLKAFTAYIKSTRFPEFVDRTGFATWTESSFMSALNQAVCHARQLDGIRAAHTLLDEIAYSMKKMQETGQISLNVWGNSDNPVDLFFWESVIDASHSEYLHHALPFLPSHFPGPIASAESSLIFAFANSFSPSIAIDSRKNVSSVEKILRQHEGPNETYREILPHEFCDTIQLAWKDAWKKVLPFSLTCLQTGSLSRHTLDSAAWRFPWFLESGLLSAFLRPDGGDVNVGFDGDPSEAGPMWMNFVLLSFCIHAELRYHDMYLAALDAFISAADMRILVPNPDSIGSDAERINGLELFLYHLSRMSMDCISESSYRLCTVILDRLLTQMIATGVSTDRSLLKFESTLPPRFSTYLKEWSRIIGATGSSFPVVGTQVPKRPATDNMADERSQRRHKTICTSTNIDSSPIFDEWNWNACHK